MLPAWGPTLRARTPRRWGAAREPSIPALDRFGLETGPGLARPDPGPLAGRIQPAGVLLLQPLDQLGRRVVEAGERDRKSTRLNSSHVRISYAVFCLKKKKKTLHITTQTSYK